MNIDLKILEADKVTIFSSELLKNHVQDIDWNQWWYTQIRISAL